MQLILGRAGKRQMTNQRRTAMVRKTSKYEAVMRFFGLKTCDTCRKALKILADRDVEAIDVRSDGVSDADRAAILDAFGAEAMNTRSTTWRGLSEDERAQSPDVLLAAYPTLMKRPVIEMNGTWYQGWTPATRAALGVE